jgi:transposase-like protein
MNDIDDASIPYHPLQSNIPAKRRRYSHQEKMSLVRSISGKIQTTQVSIRQACRDARINHKLYRSWKREYNQMKEAKNPKAKSYCPGRESTLKPIEQDLTRYIFKLREQGIGVSIDVVIRRAASQSRVFCEKSQGAQFSSVRRFTKSLGLVYRMLTHESQRDPREVASESVDFIPALPPPRLHPEYGPNSNPLHVPFHSDLGSVFS